MTDDIRAAIMAEIAACVPRPLQPHEFTIRQFADDTGMAYESAKCYITAQYRSGALRRRPLRGVAYAYWRPEDAMERGA